MKTKKNTALKFVLLLSAGYWVLPNALAQTPDRLAAEMATLPGYVFNGDTIPLSVSEEYGAFSVEEAEIPDFAGEVRRIDGVVGEFSELTNKRGIVLVRRVGDETDFADGMTMLSKNWRSYEVFGGDGFERVLTDEFIVRFENDIQDAVATRQLAGFGAEILRKSRYIPNQYIITFPDDSPRTALSRVNALARDDAYRFAAPNFVVLLRRAPEREVRGPEVKMPEPQFDTLPLGGPGAWPDDDYYGVQWGLEAIKADEAWLTTTGSCDVSVAILDDGIEWDHPDLEDKITHKWDAVWEDDDPAPIDIDYHGTSVAGIAAAMTNNGEGVAGTLWGGQIFAVRIFDGTYFESVDDPGDLDPNAITTSEIVQRGIANAVNAGADVLNLSWWFIPDDAVEDEILKGVNDEGRVFVVAVGETASDVTWPALMAKDHPLLAVGAVKKNVPGDSLSMLPASNFGPNGDEVTLVAPGLGIATTDLTDGDGQSPGDYEPDLFGDTSGAAPFVAGAAALLLSWSPGLDPGQVRDRLTGKAQITASLGSNPAAYGAGVLNVAASLEEIGTGGLSLDIELVTDNRLSHNETTTVQVTATRNGAALSGAMLSFESQDETLATVSPDNRPVPTNCDGVAEATVTGESTSWTYSDTYVTASIAGEAVSVLVRTGGIRWWPVAGVAIMLLAALGLMMYRRRLPPD